jgi:drug/metabolite transporter (DMT)-like permease
MQLLGISLTIIGVFLTIYSYINNEEDNTHYSYVRGTIYALACCLLLSLSNVIQEYVLLKGCTYIQLLGVMGCINMPITAIEALINGEYSSLVRIFHSADCGILINSLLSDVRGCHAYSVLYAANVFESCLSHNV